MFGEGFMKASTANSKCRAQSENRLLIADLERRCEIMQATLNEIAIMNEANDLTHAKQLARRTIMELSNE